MNYFLCTKSFTVRILDQHRFWITILNSFNVMSKVKNPHGQLMITLQHGLGLPATTTMLMLLWNFRSFSKSARKTSHFFRTSWRRQLSTEWPNTTARWFLSLESSVSGRHLHNYTHKYMIKSVKRLKLTQRNRF
jgi:hypothetical protein